MWSTARYIVLLVALLSNCLWSEEMFLHQADITFAGPGIGPISIEHGYEKVDIEYTGPLSEREVEYRYKKTSLGGTYSITERDKLNVSFSANHDLSPSAHFGEDHTVSYNDPALAYWHRLSKSQYPYEFYDFGIIYTPKLFQEELGQSSYGNRVRLNYRFGIGDGINLLSGTYYVGLQTSRQVLANGSWHKQKSYPFFGVEVMMSRSFNKVIDVGLELGIRRTSNEHEIVHSQDMRRGEFWDKRVGLYAAMNIASNNQVYLSYHASDKSPSISKFSTADDMDKEQQSFKIGLKLSH